MKLVELPQRRAFVLQLADDADPRRLLATAVAIGSGSLREWGSAGGRDGQFNTPSGIATDANRHVFVVDRNDERIQKFGCR